MRPKPIFVGAGHRGDSGEMKASCDALHGSTDEACIRDIADQQFSPWIQVYATAGGEVIEHHHGVSVIQQGVAKMRAYESSAAGDQEFRHRRQPSRFDQIDLRLPNVLWRLSFSNYTNCGIAAN